ncbi:MAG: tyrosine-type recombinase/integrase [Candidatus Aenigmarchaeota archaeon]|nr:tyrosine-type recombinase/integrase [Candidatus Aenigmarchaeota archaeon]
MNNKALIDKFLEFCKANGLSQLRITKYYYTLPKIAEWLNKPFGKVTKDDMIKLVGKIEETDYAEWTKHDYKAIIKRFYKWINNDEDYPDTVKWIKPTVRANHQKLPDDMLTADDIDLLISKANNIRDKALVCVLYESGCRIGEVLGIKIKNVSFDEYSPILLVNGKTGSRRLRLIDKLGLLKTWLQAHPDKDNPDEYMFVSLARNRIKNKPIEYHAVVKILRELAKLSGIKHKVNPHNFRHSRATHLANKLTEAQMKQMFGWTQNSGMASIYVHLSGRDLDEPLLKMSGLLDKETEKEEETKKSFEEKLRTNPEFRSKIAKLWSEAGK